MTSLNSIRPRQKKLSVEERILQAAAWVRSHQEQSWALAIAAAAAVAVIFFMLRQHQVQNDEAWTQLGTAQGQIMQGQLGTAAKTLESWNKRFAGSSAAAYAKFLKADLLYETSDYVSASQIYTDLAQAARPEVLRPLALSAESYADEMAGRLAQALAAAQSFTERYPDHFLAASMYMSQARLNEMAGNPAAASAIYDRFVVLYPESPWTQLAHARLQALSGPLHPTVGK